MIVFDLEVSLYIVGDPGRDGFPGQSGAKGERGTADSGLKGQPGDSGVSGRTGLSLYYYCNFSFRTAVRVDDKPSLCTDACRRDNKLSFPSLDSSMNEGKRKN